MFISVRSQAAGDLTNFPDDDDSSSSSCSEEGKEEEEAEHPVPLQDTRAE